MHITQRYAAQRTAEPRLRITTGYVPERPAGRGRDTIAAVAAGSFPPALRGVQGGARPLALSGSCDRIAAVPERVERRQRCQLPQAGAAAPTGDAERATGGGRLVSACARSSVRAPRKSARGARPRRSSAADAARVGCRGSQRDRRGCQDAEMVATPGALAGAATLRTAAAAGIPPHGAAISGAPTLRGSRCRSAAPIGERRAGFARLLHPPKGQRLPGGGAADANNPPPPRSGGGAGGGVPLTGGAWSGVTRERGSAAGAPPLMLIRCRPGWWSGSLRLAPAPLLQVHIIVPYCYRGGLSWGSAPAPARVLDP